jgi:hypothetical protein
VNEATPARFGSHASGMHACIRLRFGSCIGHACMHTAPVRLGHRRHSGGKSADGEALALARGAGNRAAGATQFSHRRAGW